MALLKVIPAGGGEERRFELGGEPLTLGRGLANTVVLRDDPRSSLRHATVAPVGEGYLLCDEGSTNGTWVNGLRVARHVLHNGDQIQLGSTLILFEQ